MRVPINLLRLMVIQCWPLIHLIPWRGLNFTKVRIMSSVILHLLMSKSILNTHNIMNPRKIMKSLINHYSLSYLDGFISDLVMKMMFNVEKIDFDQYWSLVLMITRNTFIIPLSYFCHSIVTRQFNGTDKKKPDASITELVTELVQCMNLHLTLTAQNYTSKGMSFGSEIIWTLYCSKCKVDISTGTLGFVLGTACYGILYHHGLEPGNYDNGQCDGGSENSPQMSSHPKYQSTTTLQNN